MRPRHDPPGVWREVGDRAFCRRHERYDLNVGLVAGDGAALLVDSGCTLREGAALRAEAEALAGVPVRVVVNTHAHFDHCFGNAAFPESLLWGHRRCAADLMATGGRQREAVLAEFEGEAATDLAATPIVPPTRLVDSEARCEVGGRAVRLVHLGRGHTDNDLVVVVDDARVLFAGDLVESSGPPAFEDAWPLEWPATVERVARLVTGVVVPGHGDVVDVAFVEAQRADLAALATLAARVRDGDLDSAAAVAASPFPEEATRTALARVNLPGCGEQYGWGPPTSH